MSTEEKKKDNRVKRVSLLIPMMIIFSLMFCMVLYTSNVIQSVAVTNIHEVGEDRISGVAAQLENYLEMTKSVLWVTADTVDHMAQSGASADDILKYITRESENQEEKFDENSTGIYGYVLGEYLDGAGWEPPDDYEPTERDWYKAAIRAHGDSTIVSPYLDAQTGSIIISISRMLSNGKDVLSLDVMMNRIQDIVSKLQIKGKGYGFIVNSDSMIIAHQDEKKKGLFLTDTEEQRSFMNSILETANGNFETDIDGKASTVFVHQIMDQWYVVLVVSNNELYAEIWQQLIVNVLICIIIFALIAFFYLFGHKNEQNYSRRIEEMRAEEQQQAYETKLLKLEKEAADQSNQAKSDFLAEMSHEIRTPINAVLGMNEIILRESVQARDSAKAEEPEKQEIFNNIISYAGNIKSAGNNLLSIINDILDFSKIEAGRMDLVEGEYKLSSILNDVSNMIFFRAKDKDLKFIVDVDQTLPDELYGDEVRVRQIITNVLTNAIKYTEDGSIRLNIGKDADKSSEDSKVVCLKISVKDTGIGIKPEDVRKLFSKFQRVDLSRNSTVEGTGLGLAITQRLLEMMGGSIWAESEYGIGSTFTILLPQKIISYEPIGDFEARFDRNMLKAKPYKGIFRAPDARILVVDDTRMNLTVATGLLKNTGIRIDTASSGEDAISLAKTEPYDLILMDQRMPVMDGSEAMHRIKDQDDGANRDTPVICLTADAVIGAKERYLAEGFTDYLTKPIDSLALEKMLVEYLPDGKVQILDNDEPAADANGKQAADAEIRQAADSNGEPAGTPDDISGALRAAGIDQAAGLGYCQNDNELYRSMLAEYADSAEEKQRDISRYYDEQDWKNYAILVHSVKSTSKLIGASALSEIAARLESAADEGNAEAVRAEHGEMMKMYHSVTDALLACFPAAEAFDEDVDIDEDDDIMEFMPEEGETDD